MVTVPNSVGSRFLVFSKGEAYFGKPAGGTGFRAIKHKALQVFGTEVADLLFTDHPANTVHDIALATAIRAHYSGNVFIKTYKGFISKAFEPFDL